MVLGQSGLVEGYYFPGSGVSVDRSGIYIYPDVQRDRIIPPSYGCCTQFYTSYNQLPVLSTEPHV